MQNFLPKVRNITHISFPWLYDREKLLYWHRFISIFEPHFKDVTKIDKFYFELLLLSAKKWNKQNPKRVIVESFTQILKYEGHLHNLDRCLICNREIDNNISLIKGFLPTHPNCSKSINIDKNNLSYLFLNNSSIYLDDETISNLSEIALKGF